MTINIIYHRWLKKLHQLREQEHKARLRTFALLMAGLLCISVISMNSLNISGKIKNVFFQEFCPYTCHSESYYPVYQAK